MAKEKNNETLGNEETRLQESLKNLDIYIADRQAVVKEAQNQEQQAIENRVMIENEITEKIALRDELGRDVVSISGKLAVIKKDLTTAQAEQDANKDLFKLELENLAADVQVKTAAINKDFVKFKDKTDATRAEIEDSLAALKVQEQSLTAGNKLLIATNMSLTEDKKTAETDVLSLENKEKSLKDNIANLENEAAVATAAVDDVKKDWSQARADLATVIKQTEEAQKTLDEVSYRANYIVQKEDSLKQAEEYLKDMSQRLGIKYTPFASYEEFNK